MSPRRAEALCWVGGVARLWRSTCSRNGRLLCPMRPFGVWRAFRSDDRCRLTKSPPKPHTTWHLDEVYLKIDGRMVYLWRAVDAEGEVLDVLVQSKRNKHAALKLMRNLLKKYAIVPERMITDDPGAAARDLGIEGRHQRWRWRDKRAEISHQPTRRRERKVQRLKKLWLSAEIPVRAMQLSSIPSPSNAISYRLRHTGRSAPRR